MLRFGRPFPFFAPESDPLPPPAPPPDPPVVVVPAARAKSVTCDFCGCRLGADGGVLETGERARKLGRVDDRLTALQAEIDSLKSQLSTARELLAAREAELQGGDRATAGDRWWQ